MNRFKLIFIVLFFSTTIGSTQNFENTWIAHSAVHGAFVSYHFSDVQSNKTITSFEHEKLMNPASTIKLLTSLIFLESFGDNHQYESTLSYRGNLERDGTLKGDLIFHGSGDPSFGSGRYGSKNDINYLISEIVQAIKKQGISCIDGDIIVDASTFGTDCIPHSWQWNDLGNYYACGVWSVNVNENAYSLSLDRTSNGVKLHNIYPNIENLSFTNELELGPADSGDQAYIFCAPYQNNAYIRGSIPSGKGLFTIRGSIPNAPQFFAELLAESLEKEKIKSGRAYASFQEESSSKIVWTHRGITSKRQVKSAIEKSINMYCEAFLLKMGNGSRELGINTINNYLIQHNIIHNLDEIQISDGSGLSQRNFISTKTMVAFLNHQYQLKGEKSLFPLMARNGYDGTLKNSFQTKNLKGNIYGKSGSMDGVRAYAGFLRSKSGKILSFSIMINHHTQASKEVIRHIEELLEEVWSMH